MELKSTLKWHVCIGAKFFGVGIFHHGDEWRHTTTNYFKKKNVFFLNFQE